jgi:hypothetical protein
VNSIKIAAFFNMWPFCPNSHVMCQIFWSLQWNCVGILSLHRQMAIVYLL